MDKIEATLTLIGGPTVLIELDGFRILTDPTFDPQGAYPGPGEAHRAGAFR
jgi:L-ascorbate metabolism protein UlaG (beta-lactamase superfamily)